jgi:glycosyltransferase involved in cell wall biosynthesis
MLLYWGRRGAMSRFTLDLARVACAGLHHCVTVSVSRQNELYSEFESLGPSLLPVRTFQSGVGAVAGLHQLVALRHALARRLAADRTEAVVALMPHVWSQLVIDVVHAAGARYLTVVHDAEHHPGEQSRALHAWLLRETRKADHVVTLSRTVAEQLCAGGSVPPDHVSALFLPDLIYTSTEPDAAAPARRPFRVLFFGRVLAYKGLPRLVDAVEQVRADGVAVSLGVYGAGTLGPIAARLQALDADVVNRWIPEADVARVFQQHDAVVLSHDEASQSGVAAAALGAGVPIVAVPIGGLVEQVRDGETGIIARGTDARSLADAITRLATDPLLQQRLRAGIARTRADRSMVRFLADLESIAASTVRGTRLAG